MENIHLLLSFLVDDVVDEQGCQMDVEEQEQVGLACYLYDMNASHLKLSCLGDMLNQIGNSCFYSNLLRECTAAALGSTASPPSPFLSSTTSTLRTSWTPCVTLTSRRRAKWRRLCAASPPRRPRSGVTACSKT
eukprot:scaffold654_cov207-Ochromonas_danica.AAC.36